MISEIDGRMPPQAVDIEEAILGGMLIEAEACTLAAELLAPDDFYKPAHQYIFETIAELHLHKRPADILTLEQALSDKGRLDTCGGRGYLSQLTRTVSSSANIEYHAQIVKEKSIKRKLITAGTNIVRNGYDGSTDVYDLLAYTNDQIGAIQTIPRGSAVTPIWNIAQGVADQMIAQGPGDLTGIPIGLSMDKLTGGWQPGDFIIIGGRPSMGKSVLGFQACLHPALQGIPTGFISLEMSKESLMKRLLVSAANVDSNRAKFGKLNEFEKERLAEAAKRIATPGALPIYIDDSPITSAQDVRLIARKWIREYGIQLLVVDYLQLLKEERLRNDNREQAVSRISNTLKQTAKETGLPIIALSQLARPAKGTKPKAPQLDDLRESGSIEQDADVVIFIHRPEYYGIKADEEGRSTAGLAELVVAKQRNGGVGTIDHFWNRDHIRFEDLSTKTVPIDEAIF